MSSAPHQDQFGNRKRKGATAALRHISESQRPLSRAPIFGEPAIDADRAGLRRQQTEDRLEQCGLALAVAPQHAQHFADADVQGDMAADDVSGITVAQILHSQPWRSHDHAGRRLKASSHKNTGVPSAAVRTPSGNSTVPIVRATVSTARR